MGDAVTRTLLHRTTRLGDLRLELALEFKAQDLWVGLYWDHSLQRKRLDAWLCVLPMLPVHLTVRRLDARERARNAWRDWDQSDIDQELRS